MLRKCLNNKARRNSRDIDRCLEESNWVMDLDTRVLMGGNAGCNHRLSLLKVRHQLPDTSVVTLANLSTRANKEVFPLNKAVHHHNLDSKDLTDRRGKAHQAGRLAIDNQLMVETS